MKKIFIKINNYWNKYKKWEEGSLLGNFIVSTVKIAWIMLVVFLIYITVSKNFKIDALTSNTSPSNDSTTTKDNCSVLGLNLHGELITYIPAHADGDSSFNYDVTASENIVLAIKEANDDPKIKTILVEVDSGGGSPVAGEEISNAIKNSNKPVVAMIRQTGASASYWAISGAKKIFASKNSDVGSIGVTGSYLSNVEKNKKNGYTYVQLSIGKYKDAGNPDKPLTSEEKALFLRDANIIYNNFIETVSKNRNIPAQKVKSFADGSTFLGQKAKELGLIDETGGLIEVEKYLENITGEKPVICWK